MGHDDEKKRGECTAESITPRGYERFSIWVQGRYSFEQWREHFASRGIDTRVVTRHGFSALFREARSQPQPQQPEGPEFEVRGPDAEGLYSVGRVGDRFAILACGTRQFCEKRTDELNTKRAQGALRVALTHRRRV